MVALPGLEVFIARHGFTQKGFAEAAGIDNSNLSYILRGRHRPTQPTIESILEFCRSIEPGVTYEQIFGSHPLEGTDDPSPAFQEAGS